MRDRVSRCIDLLKLYLEHCTKPHKIYLQFVTNNNAGACPITISHPLTLKLLLNPSSVPFLNHFPLPGTPQRCHLGNAQGVSGRGTMLPMVTVTLGRGTGPGLVVVEQRPRDK